MVSVCIATYNGEKYITEQIDSILSQIEREDEVIISDDGSTDGTLDVIRQMNDGRIQLLHSGTHNIVRNFENALAYARGDIIFLSDQDDVWLPSKYGECVKQLKEYDLIVSDAKVTDNNLNIVYSSLFERFSCGKGILKNIARSTYFGACMAFKREILDRALPFPDDKEIGHDLWIGLVAEMTGKVLFLPEPLILYRRHGGAFTNISTALNRSKRTLWQKLRGRCIMLKHVLSFYVNNKASCKQA